MTHANRKHISRRELLERAGAVTLALGVSILAGEAEGSDSAVRRNLRWSQGWLLWRDFPGRKIALGEALRDLKEVGADGIEFTPRPGELEALGLNLGSLRELLRKEGLKVSGHYFSGPFHDPAKRGEIFTQVQQKIYSLRALGAKNIILGPPAPTAGADRIEVIRKMAPVLTELGRHAHSQGIQIGVHPHLNTVIETPDETDAIMQATDAKYVGLALDTGHYHLAGGDVIAALEKFGARLNYLHFKDAVRPFRRPDFFPSIRELGKGEIHFPEVMRALKKIHYRGWIDVEQDFTTLTPRESCQTSMRYVREVLEPIYS